VDDEGGGKDVTWFRVCMGVDGVAMHDKLYFHYICCRG